MISKRELERVDTWVSAAVHDGAKLVTGGAKISDSLYQNTVLLHPPLASNVMQKEIFGPVVCVYPYDELSQAVEIANALPYAFQAAVFTRSLDTAMSCYCLLDGTAIMVNENSLFRIDAMPFAGVRQSGLGVGGIPHTMRDMQTEKMMVWRSDALA
ncbi:aldehyde dehydrogenase family protein [Agrobacterium leguminum]|uniref:aldehyde dehydrogenase family protein n=1 Tax=Agrobacterium leguminum TaxID=2792015 RepID=UPI001F27584D|nr:aldehyde dehydrogenase family protein [Agrobacterium leguminum]